MPHMGARTSVDDPWAAVGERPTAHGHHLFDWLYVTAFVSPASGETFWYVHDVVSKPFFHL